MPGAGFTKHIVHLDKHVVPVQSRQVVSHGEVMTIAGEGMPKFEFPSERGNLLVKFAVRMPTTLTAAQQAKVRELLGDD